MYQFADKYKTKAFRGLQIEKALSIFMNRFVHYFRKPPEIRTMITLTIIYFIRRYIQARKKQQPVIA